MRELTTSILPHELSFVLDQVEEMTNIMRIEGGIALAANQVGIPKRFFIMKIEEQTKLFINPEILEMSGTSSYEEGCLSIPGVSAKTQRAKTIKLKFKDRDFADQQEEFIGINAVAVQHEIDHLDGKLYIDKLSAPNRMLLMEKHRQFLKKKVRGQ